MPNERTTPDARTKDAERAEAQTATSVDREPTKDEADKAETHAVEPDVREHAEEMYEKGAHQQGEGRVP
jgi:hypothetical protein